MAEITLPAGADANWPGTPSALVVAHPGHQVRVHGWLEAARPHVFILTDGSGHAGRPRLDVTTQYLAGLGAEPGSIYGQHSDRTIYQSILNHEFDFFNGLADRLAESLSGLRVRFVLGDAAEGYNSIHDVCRLVIEAAVAMLEGGGGKVASFDFPVVNRPDDCPEELIEKSIWLRLDDEAFTRKIESARTYYPELLEEVRTALGNEGSGPLKDYLSLNEKGGGGLDVFRVECLRPAGGALAGHEEAGPKPFYELHGERQVKAGLYSQVIRRREHLAPIAEHLRRHVG